jgi:hypothetical protein
MTARELLRELYDAVRAYPMPTRELAEYEGRLAEVERIEEALDAVRLALDEPLDDDQLALDESVTAKAEEDPTGPLQEMAQATVDYGRRIGRRTLPRRRPHENQLGHFQRHSETSRKAAIDNYPRSGTQRWKVLTAIVGQGGVGFTRDELAAALGLAINSILPRVKELLDGEWIVETERERTTRQGSAASVLVATEKGEREWREREVWARDVA